jgi:hypothetical protein
LTHYALCIPRFGPDVIVYTELDHIAFRVTNVVALVHLVDFVVDFPPVVNFTDEIVNLGGFAEGLGLHMCVTKEIVKVEDVVLNRVQSYVRLLRQFL